MPTISHASETAIWERVIHPSRGDLPIEAAQFFLNLTFEQSDLERMHELTAKNQEGALSPEELSELKNYRQIGLQIDLLRSKARQTIEQRAAS